MAGSSWCIPNGQEGWISGRARIRVLPDNPWKPDASKMIYGGIWLQWASWLPMYLQITNRRAR